MSKLYDTDVVAWSKEQVELLKEGRLGELDIKNIAEEIADVGKSEQRELRNRMAHLLSHLLKWKFQPERRGNSWSGTIRTQRIGILDALEETPSLERFLADDKWWSRAYNDALGEAVKETDFPLETFPKACPWSKDQVLDADFFPEPDGKQTHLRR